MEKWKRGVSILALAIVIALLSGCGSVTTTTIDYRAEYYHDYISQEEFPNYAIKKVFLEYNQFYAGYSMEGGAFVIHVLESSPEEMFVLLSQFQVKYYLVRYSYNDLLVIYDLIFPHLWDSDISSVGIDVVNNRVDVGIHGDESETPDYLKGYVDSGIVFINYNEVIFYNQG